MIIQIFFEKKYKDLFIFTKNISFFIILIINEKINEKQNYLELIKLNYIEYTNNIFDENKKFEMNFEMNNFDKENYFIYNKKEEKKKFLKRKKKKVILLIMNNFFLITFQKNLFLIKNYNVFY